MRYYIQRYVHRLWKVRRWLPWVLLPPVIYLLAAAMIPDRYSVFQKISVQKAAPIALSRSPVDVMSMAEMTANPSELFLDDFALLDLANVIHGMSGSKKEMESAGLRALIESSMTLKALDEKTVLLSYYGNEIGLGKTLVNFYTQRLIGKSKEGQIRSIRYLSKVNGSDTAGGGSQAHTSGKSPAIMSLPSASPDGGIEIETRRSLWRSDRLLPSLWLFAGAMFIWLIVAGFAEILDSSFKTERQVSRYLNLPVIGIMPDLNPLVEQLGSEKSA